MVPLCIDDAGPPGDGQMGKMERETAMLWRICIYGEKELRKDIDSRESRHTQKKKEKKTFARYAAGRFGMFSLFEASTVLFFLFCLLQTDILLVPCSSSSSAIPPGDTLTVVKRKETGEGTDYLSLY